MSQHKKELKISGNPIDVDEKLNEMMGKLDGIQTKKKFTRWKSSFLSRFDSFIEKDGTAKAQEAYDHFGKTTMTFVKSTQQVQKSVEGGQLGEEKTTVKGRNALNELNKSVTKQVEELLLFIPTTVSEEKKCGYNKFQIGAVLVRDGFSIYGYMLSCRETLVEFVHDKLKNVADRQIIEAVDYYNQKFHNFCDLMADLKIYEICKKCQQFSGDGDEGEGPFIFIDVETGAIGKLPRDKVIEMGLITLEADDEDEDVIKEAITDEKQKEALKEYIKKVLG
jgi:hypothetical protein